MVTASNRWTTVLRVLEIILFCNALVLAIPPVPSEEGHVYRITPVLLIGGLVFGAALYLGVRRGAETWITALVKLPFYGLFMWAVHERIAIR
jgi:hypothetical protein